MHYVIGDVHGCFRELMLLLEKIEQADKKARFIFVGDFVDRGPEVMKVLDWAMSHIKRTGKYRSVMGNHEAMLIVWYRNFCRWYERERRDHPAPDPAYDFLDRLIEAGKNTPEAAEPYIDFFRSLPLRIRVRVPGRAGRLVTYDIVHAFTPPKEAAKKEKTECCLWDRDRALAGNQDNGHIIVHGHTPTTFEAKFDKESVPGLITYRKNAVNVDGGCVLAPKHPEAPCMMCALCLETLEEIYPFTMEERMKEQMPQASAKLVKAAAETLEKRHAAYLNNAFRKEMLGRLKGDSKRAWIGN